MYKNKYHLNLIVGERVMVYENLYQQVYKVDLNFGTFTKDLFVTDYGQRVGVLVKGPKGILLTRQYRYLIDRLSWEIPGGKVNKGESLEYAALRECLEETGVLCFGLKSLITFQPGLDTLHNPTHLYYTQDFKENFAPEQINRAEICEIKWVSIEECFSMLFSQSIVDSLSVIALLSFEALLRRMAFPD
jgi:8-oxo-dGTP pyrophosphatase MutT (NUDIX family)